MMEKYAREQASRRFNRVVFDLARAGKSLDANSVHDLRVSIRRFTHCIKVFRQFFPAKEANKAQQRLREIMRRAAELRDRDIAMELLKMAGAKTGSSLFLRLTRERKKAEKGLAGALERMSGRGRAARWRARLDL